MPPAAPTHCEIRADSVYPLSDFQRLTGLGPKATRAAARRGLKIVRIGRRSYVRGQSFIEFVDRQAAEG